MDGYKRRSQERSQSVTAVLRQSTEGGRKEGRKEGGDAERITLMDTSRLSNYAADGRTD